MIMGHSPPPRLTQMWRDRSSNITTTKAQWIVYGFQRILQRVWHPIAVFSQGRESFPSCNQIPFSSFMKIPLPFAKLSSEYFASCHLEAMTKPEFLIGDEWMGYYSYGGSIVSGLDPPMRGIIFERYHVEFAELVPLSAAGMDSVGAFTLRGRISCHNGQLAFVKQYINGPRWQWWGLMTPFGMVGMWYGAANTNRGWFWLWKANWTHGSS